MVLFTKNMESISCSIPGCKTKSYRKIAAGGENNLTIPRPYAEGLYNKWKEALKKKGIEISKEDHICERHLLENDIEHYHRTRTPDGDVEIKKRLPTPKADAVPTKLLKSSFHIAKDSSKKISDSHSLTVSNPESNPTDKSNFAVNSCDSENSIISIKVEIPDDDYDNSFSESSADPSVHVKQEQIPPKKKLISYSELIKNIQRVKKPSVSWSVVCTDQFIIFASWNNKFIAEKRIVIESSLTVRVFLKELEIEMTELMDITSVDDVSSLLEKVDSYKV